MSSLRVSPSCACAFCAIDTGEQHFTSSAAIGRMTLASNSSSRTLLKYALCGGESGRLVIFVLNFTPGLISSLCSPSFTALTSLTYNAKQLANSEINAWTALCSNSVRSSPIVTSSAIFCTRSGLNGSVKRVNIDLSRVSVISGWAAPAVSVVVV